MDELDFIEKSVKIHSDRYDYSLVNYVNSKTKVKIVCPIHGIFEQIPYSHLKGCVCRLCANENQKLTTNKFIEKSKKVHGNKYRITSHILMYFDENK